MDSKQIHYRSLYVHTKTALTAQRDYRFKLVSSCCALYGSPLVKLEKEKYLQRESVSRPQLDTWYSSLRKPQDSTRDNKLRTTITLRLTSYNLCMTFVTLFLEKFLSIFISTLFNFSMLIFSSSLFRLIERNCHMGMEEVCYN